MKTIDEATKEYSDYEAGEYVFKSGVKFAQRWIPISEELPDYLGEDILIIAKRSDNEMMVMVIEEHEDVRNLADGYWKYWRPIELK